MCTALLDVSLEVSTSLESDGKAEDQSFSLAVNSCALTSTVFYKGLTAAEKHSPSVETCKTGLPFNSKKNPQCTTRRQRI